MEKSANYGETEIVNSNTESGLFIRYGATADGTYAELTGPPCDYALTPLKNRRVVLYPSL